MSFFADIYASRKPLCGFCAIGLAWASYFAQMPVVKADVGASDGAYGVAVLWASLGAVGAMWLAPLAQRYAGPLAVSFAIAAIALGLMMGVGRLSGHGLARFVPETRLMVLACLVAAFGLIGAALAPSAVVALVFFAIAGLGVSVVAPLTLALVGRAVPARLRLAVISRVSVLGYGAFFIGPQLMGLVAQGISLSAAFVTVGAMMVLVGSCLVPYLGRIERQRV
ncbi:hypothetical protein ABMC88_00735 [Sulfitobacter sp. HNIBRBA2951]|uniref:MFS transporter n=1 Tax=Sulfitobacter aquimarinus TaxID=3158557 RepID=UPI0032DEA38D